MYLNTVAFQSFLHVHPLKLITECIWGKTHKITSYRNPSVFFSIFQIFGKIQENNLNLSNWHLMISLLLWLSQSDYQAYDWTAYSGNVELLILSFFGWEVLKLWGSEERISSRTLKYLFSRKVINAWITKIFFKKSLLF